MRNPFKKTTPTDEVLTALLDQNRELHRMLMAFNRAGLNLANHEQTMAKIANEEQQTKVDHMRATADKERAEAKRIDAENGVRPPVYGSGAGATRTIIGAGP